MAPRVFLLAFLLLGSSAPVRAADPFQDKVRPFLNTYCAKCHNAKQAKADLNLLKFTTAEQMLAEFRQWEHVVALLRGNEMPPADVMPQPTPELRAEILGVLEKLLLTEARKMAGDPGVVPPRRLTNAEYDYTIRDLTGVDIRPAKSFPIDPASGEGFNNTGEALTMSPSLFKKYFAAAEHVADHAVLTTEGLRFAPHPAVTFADRQKFYESAIISFYEKHAVEYEKYFTALWLFKHRPAARKNTTLDDVAREHSLSAKYLRSLWDMLESKTPDKFYQGLVRQRWNALPVPKNAAAPDANEVQGQVRSLAAEIRKLSTQLCTVETPAIVANAGNGPVDHLERRRRTAASRDTFEKGIIANQRFTVEFKKITEKPTIKLVVQLGDAGNEKADGTVVLNGTFSTNEKTTDGKRKWSLKSVLSEHAPDELKKLKFDGDNLLLMAPGTLELELPTKAFPLNNKGSVTFTVDCKLEGSQQGVVAIRLLEQTAKAADTAEPVRFLFDPKHAVAKEFEASGEAFCKLFPNRFVYVDATRGLSAGFHLIEGFFRDDQPLCRSVLSDAENRELDRLWSELYFVTGIWEKMLRGFVFFERSERNFLKHVDFDSFREEDPELVKDETLVRFKEVYLKRSGVKLTGEALAKHPVSIFFDDIRNGLKQRNELFKRAEPHYLKDVEAFAERAYRRPLTDAERQKLEKFYFEVLNNKEHGIEAAVRASLVRVLVSPHFCFRIDVAPDGDTVAPLSDLALASRLSFFIWSSGPDEELLRLAKAGKLRDEAVLREQVRRMLKDPKVSRFALEFFGQWLGYREFLTQEAVNRAAFPAFDDALKQAMFEEPTRVITNLIQRDRPILELLNGDSTFVNKKLAAHYGVPFPSTGDEWVEVNGLHALGRGGALGMAVFLTKNSQPQRTSPVKRGFWVVHKVLGEHIPPPPPDVAVLPAKETDTNGKTIRQLLKLHVEDAKCASCHKRFDPIGLSMEGFDVIGRTRTKDLAGRPIDNAVSLPNGKEVRGVPEFGQYLATNRKAEFTRTLTHKFLGYALGRSLQLSDQPLLDAMEAKLQANNYKLSTLFELVATSPQFRNQRCTNFTLAKFKPELPKGDEK